MHRLLFLILVSLFCIAAVPGMAQQRMTLDDLKAWAEKGDADAQLELGRMFMSGEDIPKDEAKGVEWIQKAAAQKHLEAQFILGLVYEGGMGVKKDEAKAVEWYRKSAENGFAPAQHTLAIALELGRGVAKNPEEATQWLQKAADQDHAPAQTILAAKMERGEGVAKDPAKAAQLYLRAAKQDYIQAMSRLANMYYTGKGVPVDYLRAGAWYGRAARSNDPWAANNLAWFLATCPDESLHNGEQAVQLASKALRMMDETGEDQRYEMIDTKAACLARNGEFLEAVLWQKKALSLLPQDKDLPEEERKALEAEFQARLKLYQKQAPYTEPEPKAEGEPTPLPQDDILEVEGVPGGSKAPKKKKAPSKGTVV